MFSPAKLFDKESDKKLKKEIAKKLKTNPELLEQFETEYKEKCLNTDEYSTPSNKEASAALRTTPLPEKYDEKYINEMIKRIVAELCAQTERIEIKDNGKTITKLDKPLLPSDAQYVSKAEIDVIEKELRPQLTGELATFDLDPSKPSYVTVVEMLLKSIDQNGKIKRDYYNMFRQGLDILDLDPIMYEILGRNRNSMGYWLPAAAFAVWKHDFFKIPETIIAKVPLPLLQLSRLGYETMTPSTLKIVDDWAMDVYKLDPEKKYFIKNGVFSSKFDFRNAKVEGEKEVKELGEYLLYIQAQATEMANPLNSPIIYGAATTNEWVVREFIDDLEDNPCIYKGLPLHTEYRVFVDFDTDELLSIVPYWDSQTMKDRFSNYADASSPHQRHDYIVYEMHEETLMKRYEENKDKVAAEIEKLLPDVDLTGQWSIDIMQNGSDFWLIDMAIAENSMFCNSIPIEKRRPSVENWLPDLSEKRFSEEG